MFLTRKFKVTDFRAVQPTDQNETKSLEGHAAVFNSMTSIGGWYNEIIERGAFDGCDFDDVLFFVNHNTDKIPLARSRRNNGNSTMQLSVDNTGLLVKADLDTENNQEARQLYSSVERGDIDGMSFMFRVKDDAWENLDTDTPTRKIKKISKVYEVSAVNWPAYDDTDINARDKAALDNAKLALENARSQELENSKALDILKLKNKILGGL
ncbi:Caudovirus prohead protease [Sporomusa ovata DSM 2662]|uniref:Phage head maturation protease n=1 Tax=Sporomusa ovata TaxID=2378 RepID=A0A0U1L0V7_9FIRM|nr:HK97 family phage prohead protease [Sporomusa ovata]EQB27466.1 phage prohead protease, HK97 family [Sporomusa ovata DSM 2662]CQR73310.1 Phage head maturation protease [Sporomusa ovata]